MLIWQGFGILAILIPFIYLIAALFLSIAVKMPSEYLFFGTGFTMAFAAITIWLVGKRLNDPSGKVLIDPETNIEIVINKNIHTLFWIPMQWFAVVIAAFALFGISTHFS